MNGIFAIVNCFISGVEDYVRRYNKGYLEASSTLKPASSFDDPSTLRKVKCYLESEVMNTVFNAALINLLSFKIPLDKLKDKRQWRDEQLADLAKLKVSKK